MDLGGDVSYARFVWPSNTHRPMHRPQLTPYLVEHLRAIKRLEISAMPMQDVVDGVCFCGYFMTMNGHGPVGKFL